MKASKPVRNCLAFILIFGLASCGGKGPVLTPSDQPRAEGATTERVLVATTRVASADPGLYFEGARSDRLAFLNVSVSVPPDRSPGEIKFPSQTPDPAKEFLSLGQNSLESDALFLAAVNNEMRARPPGQREIIVFTHGYNTTFPESVFRMAQIDSDFGFKGLGVLYSWPSAGKMPLYVYDRDSVLFAREGLTRLLELLAKSDADQIFLMGHSMGALLTMETLRSLALAKKSNVLNRLNGVILAAPDIDVDVFRNQIGYVDTAKLPVIVIGSRGDRALKAASFVTGGHPRVGDSSTIDTLRGLGIIVVDVTGATDVLGPDHLAFTTSPTLLSLIQDRTLAEVALNGRRNDNIFLRGAELAFNVSATLVYLPFLGSR